MEATLDAMSALGARPSRVAAVLGPCIHQPSYEVGADLRDQVLARAAEHARFFAAGARPGKWQFDLPGYCLARLQALGLRAVASLGADTYADDQRFFSFRRATHDGTLPIGHQLSAIALPG